MTPTKSKRDFTKTYRAPEGVSEPERAAHALDWAATNMSHVFIQVNELLKVVRGLPHLPRMTSPEVHLFRGKMNRVNVLLQKNYRRMLVALPGIGVRATVDDSDGMQNALPRRMARLAAAKRSVVAAVDLIDPAKIPATAELAPWKKWLTKDVAGVVREIGGAEFERRCLPPKQDEDDE